MLWKVAQVVGLLVTVGLLAALLLEPEIALLVLWSAAIPLLPATFLINPGLWRNVCPLATLNMFSGDIVGHRRLTARLIPPAGLLGIVLLAVMVPARRFLFNANAVALASTIAAVALAALVLGIFFEGKAGFCNSICPVLPVERLYGQSPLMQVSNPRCPPCTLCTNQACIDVAPTRSIALTLGGARASWAWLGTGYGVFAAAFPGFVLGYYLTEDGPLTAAAGTYAYIAMWAAASYVITALTVRLVEVPSALALSSLGGVAAAIYYWFAALILATTFSLGPVGATGLRISTLALVGFWWWRTRASELWP